ncbi:MAG: SIS domain-containing protein, partial [Clostridiales bacterium]
DVIYTLAGPEIAVASTKAYITQLAAFYILTFAMAKALNKIDDQELAEIIQHFCCLPEKVEELLDNCVQDMQEIANDFKNWNDAFFVGRGMDYAVAMEGSLKLKEISYVHAEAYAAGELKHGTLALITKEVPVIALCTQRAVLEKTISNIKEIKARDAYTIGIAFEGDGLLDQVVDKVIYLPETIDLLAPILAVVPLQLLAYYAAIARECNVDQPRNLAKSVTVE